MTTNLQLNWDGSTGGVDQSGGTWGSNAGAVSPQDWTLDANVFHHTDVRTNYEGITGSYDWTGPIAPSAGASTAPSFEAIGTPATDFTQQSASFEIWYRPGSATGQYVLFETGDGTDGLSFTIDDGVIQFTAKNGANDFGLSFDLPASAIDTDEFVQVVGVINLRESLANPNDTSAALYVNGTLRSAFDSTGATITGTVTGTNPNSVNDWGSADGSGLGSISGGLGGSGGSVFGGLGGYNIFNNEIAIVRDYNAPLNATGVQQNHAAVVPEPGTWAMLALGAIGLVGWDQRRRRKAKPEDDTSAETATA